MTFIEAQDARMAQLLMDIQMYEDALWARALWDDGRGVLHYRDVLHYRGWDDLAPDPDLGLPEGL